MLALSLFHYECNKIKEDMNMNSGDTVWVMFASALVLLMTIPVPVFFY